MRFKDFMVKNAIQRNYNDKILCKSDSSVLDMVYTNIADKLGYKLVSEEKVDAIKCHNKD